MKIGIIGGGSIGLLFASYLKDRFEVTVYTRTRAQADEINLHGLKLAKGIETIPGEVRSEVLCEPLLKEDLIIVAVKQYQLDSVIPFLLSSTAGLLFLQNGMGHLKLLPGLKSPNIYVGSVEHGAFRENLNTVRHNGAGATKVAVYRGSREFLDSFVRAVPVSFPTAIEPDYYVMLSNKLTANAVINPLTAILGVKNGELVQNPYYEKAMEGLLDEVAEILTLGDRAGMLLKVKDICRNTAENRSSMLKDIEAGRQTEVEAILGYLLEEAEASGKKPPRLACLYDLLKGKELNGGVAAL